MPSGFSVASPESNRIRSRISTVSLPCSAETATSLDCIAARISVSSRLWVFVAFAISSASVSAFDSIAARRCSAAPSFTARCSTSADISCNRTFATRSS